MAVLQQSCASADLQWREWQAKRRKGAWSAAAGALITEAKLQVASCTIRVKCVKSEEKKKGASGSAAEIRHGTFDV